MEDESQHGQSAQPTISEPSLACSTAIPTLTSTTAATSQQQSHQSSTGASGEERSTEEQSQQQQASTSGAGGRDSEQAAAGGLVKIQPIVWESSSGECRSVQPLVIQWNFNFYYGKLIKCPD